ncbi:MAG: hypothetical protein ABSH41_18655 [Syntrophobacteraceae bacterium]|jgi:hemerythrin
MAPISCGSTISGENNSGAIPSGDGDGLDPTCLALSSIIMFQDRIYLVDAPLNILNTLSALGIGVAKLRGYFILIHTTTILPSLQVSSDQNRIKYFSTSIVRSAFAKKFATLTLKDEVVFSDYFEIRDLV